MRTLQETAPGGAVIVGAGYIGLEMADALTVRGLAVTQIERLPEVLPTVSTSLGALVRGELEGHGVSVLTGTTVKAVSRAAPGAPAPLAVEAVTADGREITRHAGLVLVVTGVRPETSLAVSAGVRLRARGAIDVDTRMRTGVPGVYAAGDCVITGENAAGGHREFAGSLGTQVVKIFDSAAARTGLRHAEAVQAGYEPLTVACSAIRMPRSPSGSTSPPPPSSTA
jgi:pyruvate/2-oxoglutarate dehydrogenase complex dihydrolipoamide dehydrogenase (E3) component